MSKGSLKSTLRSIIGALQNSGSTARRWRNIAVVAVSSGLVRVGLIAWWGPFTTVDSSRYFSPDNPLSVFDWTGQRGSPAPIVQALWLAHPIPALLAQGGLGSLAWGFAAVVVGRLAKSRLAAWLGALTVLAMSWLDLVVRFDTALLTEPINISGTLLALTGSFCIAIPRVRTVVSQRFAWAAVLVGLGLSALSRPPNIVCSLPVVIVAIGISWRRPSSWRMVAVGSLAILTAYAVVVSLNDNSSPRNPEELARTVDRLALRASPEWVAAAESTGLRLCAALSRESLIDDAQASYTYLSLGPFTQRVTLSSDEPQRDSALAAVEAAPCPGMKEWIVARHLTATEQVLLVPLDSARQYFEDLMTQWSPHSPAPEALPVIRLSGWRLIPLNLVAFLTLAASVVSRRRSRARGVSVNDTRGALLLIATTYVSWGAFSILTWLVDSMELARHFLPVSLLFAPLTILAALSAWPRASRVPLPGT